MVAQPPGVRLIGSVPISTIEAYQDKAFRGEALQVDEAILLLRWDSTWWKEFVSACDAKGIKTVKVAVAIGKSWETTDLVTEEVLVDIRYGPLKIMADGTYMNYDANPQQYRSHQPRWHESSSSEREVCIVRIARANKHFKDEKDRALKAEQDQQRNECLLVLDAGARFGAAAPISDRAAELKRFANGFSSPVTAY
eukprot:gnl/TRDRNA2_/TRDRNA2_188428_c0_seq1.p1 gnl/TRDRNA2_/TRDRNA2_188428_c0~~gnl/TRDRNA2_/TRDRNA2_188428_c0_seq1.p1  ORF type:complete len:196 (+),score=38.15 gnl/TRDRNA2_/TRDRNA2_188428_c0_seq1:100-687(+)